MHTLWLDAARLACPVGMGLMMWMMMRGMRRRDPGAAHPADTVSNRASEVDALRTEVELLKADQAARLATRSR